MANPVSLLGIVKYPVRLDGNWVKEVTINGQKIRKSRLTLECTSLQGGKYEKDVEIDNPKHQYLLNLKAGQQVYLQVAGSGYKVMLMGAGGEVIDPFGSQQPAQQQQVSQPVYNAPAAQQNQTPQYSAPQQTYQQPAGAQEDPRIRNMAHDIVHKIAICYEEVQKQIPFLTGEDLRATAISASIELYKKGN